MPDGIAFARVALRQRQPDAINLWIGTRRSVTALHRDNYENIYVVLRGLKHFVLLPPLCQPCVRERPLRGATYVRGAGASNDGGDAAPHPLVLLADTKDGCDRVPFATWDPDQPLNRTTKYSHLARPLQVTLKPGDMLYLPAMW